MTDEKKEMPWVEAWVLRDDDEDFNHVWDSEPSIHFDHVTKCYAVPEAKARALWEGARMILEMIDDGDLMPSDQCYYSGNCDKLLAILRKGIGE